MDVKLNQHFEKMQAMCVRYLVPEPYTDLQGVVWSEDAMEGFVSDMIYMLDGPEQRAAQGKYAPPLEGAQS